MSDDIKTVQMTHGEAMEALWRREQVIKRLQRENEKLREALKRLHDAASDGLKDDELVKREKDWWRFEIRAAAAALEEPE